MDAKTLRALNESIDKWEINTETVRAAIKAGTAVKRGPRCDEGVIGTGSAGCPLCKIFTIQGNGCNGCPVMARTGQTGCEGTPYEDVYELSNDYAVVPDADLLSACEAEVAFLRSLLPAEG